ncbi:MAG: hypothetical protein NZ958_08195 [Bacteroidia bacterium]|nr:hypothetical protein [Bacteroidia bacterium]MDW8088538.1 hypothetical protein [Bacteroidia bacterium]
MARTPQALQKLEALFKRHGYKLRYLRGHFRGAPCRLYAERLIVLNALYPPAGQLRALAAIADQLKSQLTLTPEEEQLIQRYAS